MVDILILIDLIPVILLRSLVLAGVLSLSYVILICHNSHTCKLYVTQVVFMIPLLMN